MQTAYRSSTSPASEHSETRKVIYSLSFARLLANPAPVSSSGEFEGNPHTSPAANTETEVLSRSARMGGTDLAVFWANL